MKAVFSFSNGNDNRLVYGSVDEPRMVLGSVLIKVEAIVVDTRDLVTYSCTGVVRVPGCQFAGTVIAVGPSVEDRAVGDRVVAIADHGSHAEFALAKTQDTWIVPEHVSFDIAASIPFVWGAAHESIVEFGRVASNDLVFIHTSLEAFGVVAVQLAKRSGARIVVTAATIETLHVFRSFGADIGIYLERQEFVTEIYKLTAGRGASVVVECMTGASLSHTISSLGYRGKLLAVATSPSELAKSVLCRGNKRIQGILFESSYAVERERLHRAITDIISDVALGRLAMTPIKRFPLSDVKEAYRFAAENNAYGKVALIPDN